MHSVDGRGMLGLLLLVRVDGSDHEAIETVLHVVLDECLVVGGFVLLDLLATVGCLGEGAGSGLPVLDVLGIKEAELELLHQHLVVVAVRVQVVGSLDYGAARVVRAHWVLLEELVLLRGGEVLRGTHCLLLLLLLLLGLGLVLLLDGGGLGRRVPDSLDYSIGGVELGGVAVHA